MHMVGCFRQGDSSGALGGSGGEALHVDLHFVKGSRRVCASGSVAGCPEPDPAELPAWPERQREWTAARGACLLPEGHLSHHHPQGGLPWRGLLHMHLWPASNRLKASTDLPHCYRWVGQRLTRMGVVRPHTVLTQLPWKIQSDSISRVGFGAFTATVRRDWIYRGKSQSHILWSHASYETQRHSSRERITKMSSLIYVRLQQESFS